MIDVSVVLINYKTHELCKNVVASIKEKTSGLSYEMIIIDNSNDENEYAKLQALNNDAFIIDAKGNLGFGGANNLGAKKARGKYLFFLNSDTILINNAIKELFDFMENKKDALVCGANLYDTSLKPNVSYELKEKNVFYDSTLLGLLMKKFNKNYYFNYKNRPLRVKGYISGACLMIDRKTFDTLGGFDKNIFMYAEDSLLCFRVNHETKSKVFNVPSAKIIHLEGGSFKEDNEKRIKMFVDGNTQYYIAAFGPRKAIKYLSNNIKLLDKKINFARKRKQDDLTKKYILQKRVYNNKLLEMESKLI